MADSDKILKLLIEMGVVGQEDVKASTDLVTEMGQAATGAGKATEDLGKKEKEASEHADKLHISHRALHQIFHMLGRETVPAFGHALNGALFGPIGIAIALGAAIEGIRHSFEQSEKAAEEFHKALEEGADVAAVTKAAGDFQSAVSASAVSAAQFTAQLAAIANAQKSIKEETDLAVTALQNQMKAEDAIAASQLKARKADINADDSLSDEEKAAKIAQLEGKASEDKNTRTRKEREDEIAARAEELEKTKAAAAVAAAAVPAAQQQAFANAVQPERREKIIESLKAQIEAAEKQNKDILEQIGPIGFSDNSKTDFTSKLPGATSDEAGRYQVGKATVESNTALIENFKEALKKLDTPESKTKVDVDAKTADESLKEAEDKAKKLATRVNELETELASKKKDNFLQTSVETEVQKNDDHARGVEAYSKAEAASKKDIESAGSQVSRNRDAGTHLDGGAGSIEAQRQLAASAAMQNKLAQDVARAHAVNSNLLPALSAMLQEIIQTQEILAARIAASRKNNGGG